MAKTAMRTISGSAPQSVADRVQRVAAIEDRSPSQIVVSAVDLYTRLPAEAHLALRRIESLGGEAQLERVLVELGRHILDREFDAARSAVAATLRVDALGQMESDKDFLSAASTAVARTGAQRSSVAR